MYNLYTGVGMNIDNSLARTLSSLIKNQIKQKISNNDFYLLLKNILYDTHYYPINDDINNSIHGTFAICLYCKNNNYIIKTNILSQDINEDGTSFWLEYVLSSKTNKNLPNIIYHYIQGNYYFVIMERLYEISNYIPYIESSSIIDILNKKTTYQNYYDMNEKLSQKYQSKYTPILIETIPTFINILTPIVNNYKDIELDICSDNIMVRAYQKNIKFILLDPFWRIYGTNK